MPEIDVPAPAAPDTPNPPGAVTDTRDGITVESNTGTSAELKAGLDALDAAIDTQEPVREEKTGRFTSKARRSDPIARMQDATAKEATAKRERDEAKAEAARYKAELDTRARPAAPPPAPPAPPPQFQPPPDPEPQPTQYANGPNDPQYLRDIGKWEARQEYQKQRAADQRMQAQERYVSNVETGMKTYAKRMQESFPDANGLKTFLADMPKEILDLRPTSVQQLVAPGTELTAHNVIADCISDADKPVQVMAYFKDHPDTFQRLLTLHPIQVFREMGRIEATLAAASPTRTAPMREPVSRSRPPVQRVESVPQVSDEPPGDNASDDDHAAYYNRKEIARRYGRG